MPTVAAIDVGTNAIRLLVADVTGPRQCQIVENCREAVRLGKDVFTRGVISEETIERAVEAFVKFRGLIDARRASHVRAVGTSAMREAQNRDFLVDQALQLSGIEVSVIEAAEEARLIHLAVAAKIELKDKLAMLVDIGGGSVEVTLADDRSVLATESYAMGSVRLLQVLEQERYGQQRFNQLVREYVHAAHKRLHKEIGGQKIDLCVGTGGSVESLGDLRKQLLGKGSAARITAEELDSLVKSVQAMTFEQRVQDLRLRPDRADVIVPAAMVLQAIVRQAGVEEVLIPGVGLKDGLLLDIAAELYDDGNRLHREQVIASALQTGRKYAFDEQHARTVAKLATQFFDQTRSLHNLDSESRLLLEAACLLHDIGHFVNTFNHHKHTQYLLTAAPLIGLNPRQMAVVSNAARYHRKSLPKIQHEQYRMLSPRDRVTVSKLASMLRLADALDREHANNVTRLEVEYKKPGLVVRLHGEGDMMLEKWAVASRCGMFEEIFGAKIVLEG